MKRTAVLCAMLVLAAFGPVPVRASESRALPDDVLGLFEVCSPTSYEQKLQNLVLRITPGMPVAGALQQAAAGWARTDDPTVLNLGAPLQWVVFRGESLENPVFVFSVLDDARYLDALSANLYGGETDGDVYLYEEDPEEAAGEGVWEAPAAKPLAIAVLDRQVVLGRSAEGVKKVAVLVQNGDLGKTRFFASADMGGTVRLRQVLASLAEQGEDPFQTAADDLDALLMMAPQQTEEIEKTTRMFRALTEIGRSASQQMETVSGTVSFSPQSIVCTADVQPVEGGELATYLATLQGGRQDLLALMPATSVAVTVGHMGDPTMLMEFYTWLMGKMAPADGSEDATLARLTEETAKTATVLDGRFAGALVIAPKGSFVFASACGINDVPRAKELFSSFAAIAEDQAKLQSGMNSGMAMHVTTNPNVAVHAGHEIAEWDYRFEFQTPDDAMPDDAMPVAAKSAAMQKELMTLMFGGDLKAYSTFLDDSLVTFQGAGTLDAIKAVIDGTLASAAKEPRLKSALAGMPEKPVLVGYVTLSELLGAYMKMVSAAMQAAGEFFPIGEVHFAPAPAVAFAAAVNENGTLETRLAIPVDAIASITNGFIQAFTNAMGGQMAR